MKRISTLVIGGLLAVASICAHAQDKPYLFQGPQRIGLESLGNSHFAGQCLIRGNNGHGEFVRHTWSWLGGPARYCGFQSGADFFNNAQGLFEVVYHQAPGAPINQYTIRHAHGKCLVANANGTTSVEDCAQGIQTGRGLWLIDTRVKVGGTVYATIRDKTNNECLTFSYATDRPTLRRWDDNPADLLYCGRGLDTLQRAGESLFTINEAWW